MRTPMIASAFLIFSAAAQAETYEECIDKVTLEQARCYSENPGSPEVQDKCNKRINEMQKRCDSIRGSKTGTDKSKGQGSR